MMGNLPKIWHNASRSSLPMQLFVALLLLCAYQLAAVTWYWLSPPWLVTPHVAYQSTETTSFNSREINVESVVSHHLFGEVVESLQVMVEAPIKAPETKLRLELRGVIASGDTFGAAIIADDAKVESYYRVGDSLPGNVRLHEVYVDKVILDRGGQYETLSLPVERGGLLGGLPANSTDSVSFDSLQIRHDLLKYRTMLQTDPQQLMGLMRATPVSRAGQQIGYRIAPGRDRSLLGKFGLRPGDIVTSINGTALTSPANGLALMRDLNSAKSLSVEIERNGGKQSLQFSLD